MASARSTDYFADPRKKGKEFIQGIKAQLESYEQDLQVQAIRDEQYNAYCNLYPVLAATETGISSSRVTRTGEQGELAEVSLPWARSLLKSLEALLTNAQLSWEPRATSSDSKVQSQIPLTRAVFEDVWNKQGFKQVSGSKFLSALGFGEGFIVPIWSSGKGQLVAPPQEAGENTPAAPPTFAGGLEFLSADSWDVARARGFKTFEESPWVDVTVYRSVHDVIAMHPDQESEILQAQKEYLDKHGVVVTRAGVQTDAVPVHHFLHRRSPAVPFGRHFIWCGDAELGDRGFEEGEPFPVHRFVADELKSTVHPFTPFWPTLGSQEVCDSILSSVTSNLTGFGTPIIGIPAGGEISADDIGPFRVVEIPAGATAPQAVSLSAVPPGSMETYAAIKAGGQELLNLSDAARGQSPSAQPNAQAWALLVGQVLQNIAPTQDGRVGVLSAIGENVLWLFQTYMQHEEKVEIAGQETVAVAESSTYSGEKLQGISGIRCVMAPPLMQTDAGRQVLFDQLKEFPGFISSPEVAVRLLTTGKVDSRTSNIESTLRLIDQENEALRKGQDCPVLATDHHPEHGRSHLSTLDSPEVRGNPQLVQVVLAHVQKHMEQFYGEPVNPQDHYVQLKMMQMLGLPSGIQPPPVIDPTATAGQPGGAPHPAPAPAGAGHPGGGPPRLGPTPENPEVKMPKNPSTGQRFNAVDGGGAVRAT